MATYYDYQRRDPNTEVNWAEVGANFSNIIKEEHRVREERKEAIKESTRQQQIQFDTAVMGDSSNMNNWTLDYADKGTKQLQMLTRLLESGDMKIKDFTNSRQNLSDGTEQLFDLAAGYQSEFKKKMARANCTDPSGVGCSSQIETDLMASVEGFGNFANSEALIDPQTSRVMVGFSKYNEDKKIWELDEDPNSLVGINSLNNRIKQEFNLYDMDSAVAAKKESTGKFETIVKQTGNSREKGLLIKFSDPRMRTKENIDAQIEAGYLNESDRKFLEAWAADTDVWLDGELAKPNVVSSLITNNLANVSGSQYSFTFDEAEAAADKTAYTILLKNKDDMVVYDWTTKNGKIQYDRAKEGLRTVLNGAMDHTVEVSAVADYTKPNQKTGNEEKPKDIFRLIPTTTATGKGTGKPRPGSTIDSQEEGQSFVFANNAGDKGIKGVISDDADAEMMMVNYNPDTQRFTASVRYTEKVTRDSGGTSGMPGPIIFNESGQDSQSGGGKQKAVSTDTGTYDVVLNQTDIGLLAVELGLYTQGNLVKEIMKTINPSGSTSKYNTEKK